MEKTDRQRYAYIDLLECIAIFFVVIYHSCTYPWNVLGEVPVTNYLSYFLRTTLSTGVPLFFFANGYLLLNREFNLKKHLYKCGYLIGLTILWSCINVLLMMPIKDEFFTLKGIIDAVWNLKQGWTNHFWYMGALIVIYIFFPLLKVAYDKSRTVFYYFIIIVAILTFGNSLLNGIATLLLYFLRGDTSAVNLNWFNMFNPFRNIRGYAIVYFCMGGLAKELVEKLRTRVYQRMAMLSIVLSMAGLFLEGVVMSKIKDEMWDVVWYGYDTIFTFVNVLAVFCICLLYEGKNRKLKEVIKVVACNTLGIYFIHMIYVFLFQSVAIKHNMLTTIAGNVFFSVVILFLSLITALIIKRVPGIRKLLL